MQEIKLHTSAKERRKFEDMADLYAIIKVAHARGLDMAFPLLTVLSLCQTTEHLEKAYIRDAITEKEVRLTESQRAPNNSHQHDAARIVLAVNAPCFRSTSTIATN